MLQTLSKNQIDYIFFHLSFFIDLTDLEPLFIFQNENNKVLTEKKIIFRLSTEKLNIERILFINSIPVLFPVDAIYKPYSMADGSLVFHHDLLKSAFYLLSGYQEWKSDKTDSLGRYPYNASIHEKLGITETPIVNYYFEWIINGLKEYCSYHNIPFKTRRPFDSGIFILSHDIDRITKYDVYETIYKIFEFIGLKPTRFSRLKLLKLIPKYFYHFLFTSKNTDPFWNFSQLRNIENKLGIRSSWYFLEKHAGHDNSRYRFNDQRIKELMQFLADEKCEIGLHGTVQSANDLQTMKSTLDNLKKSTSFNVIGNRQHKLIFTNPQTFRIQQDAGLKYDHTLTFAEHEGFRNSYCLPFHPYDFEKDEMMKIWEIPLVAMDGTLFYYRNLTFSEIEKQIDRLINEVEKFGGIFSLLWHNSHFDEDEFPGINLFYEKLLEKILNKGLSPKIAAEVIEMIRA
jgi:hypothetical protein